MTAIVILGAAVWENGPSPTLRRRTAHGAKLYHEGLGAFIVPCGGTGKYPPSEANAMRELLLAEGVSDDCIYLEDRSTTTYENLRNARTILASRGTTEIIIVTDAYHGLRALMVARALGFRARVSAPPVQATAYRVHLRRLWHEALALPGYAVGLVWWLWRDRP